MLTSQYFPAWFLGNFPNSRVILTSYESDFAASWGRKAREVLREFGPMVFGVNVSSVSQAANRWDIAGHSGGMVTAGAGGAITGRGADLLIVDDPIKNAEESRSPTIREKVWDWWRSTALTRLEPNAGVVVIMTRWHTDDLVGRMMRENREFDSEPIVELRLPAIAIGNDPLGRRPGEPLWPARYPLDELRKYQADPYWWSALYQQDPTAEGAREWAEAYFDRADFWFDEWPAAHDIMVKTIALDPSKGADSKAGDYSAYVMYARTKDRIEWIEADVRRRDSKKIVDAGCEHVDSFRPDGFAIEANAMQHLFAPLFRTAFSERGMAVPSIYLLTNTVPKSVRIRRLTEPIRSGCIRFRDTPGTRVLVQQLRDFPLGQHDDGPDALEMARRLAIDISHKGPRR